jgi:hypothetical protein
MNKHDVNDYLAKPAVVGASSALLFAMIVPSEHKVLGFSGPIGLGIVAAGGSVVSSVLADTVYEQLPESESDMLYATTAPVITGLSTMGAGVMMLGNSNARGMVELFGCGFLGEVMGAYVDEMVIKPALKIRD